MVFSVPTYVHDMIFLLTLYPFTVHVNATKGFCLFVGQTETEHYHLLLQTDKE